MNELTLIEQNLLRAIAKGLKPKGDEPGLERLEELGLVRRRGLFLDRYVVTVEGDKMLPKRVKA